MKVLIETFGCRANQYDSERVRSLVLSSGCEVVDTAEEADVAIFNSCAVTSDAEADLRQKVRRRARENPQLHSVIMGCASGLEIDQRGRASADGVSLMTLPTVDSLIGGADFDTVAKALGVSNGARPGTQRGARGLLRIQDGCDERCTFCATTIARGANRSRGVAELVEEAAEIARTRNEIVLTGAHIGSYGGDIGTVLSALVETLIARVPSVRFRLSSLEATEVDARLIEIFREDPRRLVPYLHAPLQSGSNSVLKRMGRHWYDAYSYAAAIERILDGHAWFGLGADVIAGFPGETKGDHGETVALVESLPFTSLHVFPYSARPGTAAPRLRANVHSAEVTRRARELRAIAAERADAYARRRAGSIADVVVIRSAAKESGKPGEGLTEDYLTVQIIDEAVARGSRFDATLMAGDAGLVAHPTPSPRTPSEAFNFQ